MPLYKKQVAIKSTQTDEYQFSERLERMCKKKQRQSAVEKKNVNFAFTYRGDFNVPWILFVLRATD